MNKNIFLILGVILAFFSSCQKNLKDIIHDTESATFIIYTYDEYGAPLGSGSGFFIDSDGTGITNYHVLDGAVWHCLLSEPHVPDHDTSSGSFRH